MADLKAELDRLKARRVRVDNYILITNVPLSAVAATGTHDRLAAIARGHPLVKRFHVWGFDDICRMLDNFADIRTAYLHLITVGDVVADLLANRAAAKLAKSRAIKMYLANCYDHDKYIQLDQAGETVENQVPLKRVFIDLDLRLRDDRSTRAVGNSRLPPALVAALSSSDGASATKTLVEGGAPRCVIIGGPGQGKSTIGQFVSQFHRAHLLDKLDDLDGEQRALTPQLLRLPFRIVLREYAQWMGERTGTVGIETYIAAEVSDRAQELFTAADVHDLLAKNPSLIVLDGLDEVTDPELSARMVREVGDFVTRAETVLKADLQIIATSRPTSYHDDFDPAVYVHFTLPPLTRAKIVKYTAKWVAAKNLDASKSRALQASVAECAADQHFSRLMTTPLQVTIFVLIILGGGTPPRQREELFNEYLEVIYKREKAKSRTIIQTDKRLLFGLHQYLGYILHSRAATSMDVAARLSASEFEAEVHSYLRIKDPHSEDAIIQKRVRQFMKEAHDRLVLLVGLEKGYLGFELRSIQEFFAACYLTDSAESNTQRLGRFQAIALPAHWRNVALFFAGRIGRSYAGEAGPLLKVCRDIDLSSPDIFLRRGAWLALDMAIDQSFDPDKALQRTAIEYALTLAEGPEFSANAHRHLEKFRQIPRDDLYQHLKPLIEASLSAPSSCTGTRLDLYNGLFGATAFLESRLMVAMRIGKLTPRQALDKAMLFKMRPRFVRREFGEVWKSLSIAERARQSEYYFAFEGEYLLKVWRALDVDYDTARLAFISCIERGYHHSRVSPRLELPRGIADDPVRQLAFAWDILCQYEVYDYGWATSGHRTATVSRQEARRADLLMRYLTQKSTTVELRLCVLLYFDILAAARVVDGAKITVALEKGVRWLSRRDMDLFEHLAYLLGAPGIELRGVRPKRKDRYDFLEQLHRPTSRADPIDRGFSELALVDALPPNIALPLLKKVRRTPTPLDRASVRLRGSPNRATGDLPGMWVATVLGLVGANQSIGKIDLWRRRGTLVRVASCRLRKAKPIQFSRAVKLYAQSRQRDPRTLAALTTQAMEIGVDAQTLSLLFTSLATLPKAAPADRLLMRSVRLPEKAGIKRAFEIGWASETSAAGFAKWLWYSFAVPRTKDDSSGTLPYFPVKSSEAAQFAKGQSGAAYDGALLILAHSIGLNSDDVRASLLRASDPSHTSVSVVLRNLSIREGGAAASLLEEILAGKIEVSDYGRAVAAMEYGKLVQNPAEGIAGREVALGLPVPK